MKKNKLILLQLVIAFTLICTSVYAAVNTTIELKVSNGVVKRGEKVAVTLSLKDVNEEKIESIEGYINYNKNVIEPIDINSIEKNEDNTITIGSQKLPLEDLTNATIENMTSTSDSVAFNGNPAGDEDNDSRIVIDFKEPITADTDILTINFTVKSDATLGEIKQAITYSLFVVTADAGQSEQITQDVAITVEAVQNKDDDDDDANKDTNTNTNDSAKENKNSNQNTNKNTNTNTNKNTNTNRNTNQNVNNNKNTNSNTDKTTADSTLPATGARIIAVPAIILMIIAYVCYNRYMKYKDI